MEKSKGGDFPGRPKVESPGRPKAAEADTVEAIDLSGDPVSAAVVEFPEAAFAAGRRATAGEIATMVTRLIDAPGGAELAHALAIVSDGAETSHTAAKAMAARLMTAPEVQVALRLPDIKAAYTMVRVGKLPAVKIGKRLLFARATVERVIADLEAMPPRPVIGGGVAVAQLGPAPPPIRAATKGRVLRRLPAAPAEAFPSAPLLHGAHTLLACADARRDFPPTVDAVCTIARCPLAARTERTLEEQERWKAERASVGGAMLCEHANEVPTGPCPCEEGCYCRGRTCAADTRLQGSEGDGPA